MCYFLYGVVNKEINIDDYDKLFNRKTLFKFKIGTLHDVKKSVADKSSDYRLTDRICDCETAIGTGKTEGKDIDELSELITDMRKVEGIKHVYLSKNWFGERIKSCEEIHVDDVDLIEFLSNLEDNCLYKLLLYKRYY